MRDLRGRAIGQATVSYFTDARRPRRLMVNDLEYRFWPRSFRRTGRHDGYRREWSGAALVNAAFAPSDVTIVNTSGHGGRFAQLAGRVLGRRHHPYVAMIGGLAASFEGPQRRFLAGASVIAVHTRHLRDRCVAAGLESRAVAVVPLGVDTEVFVPPMPRSAEASRSIVLYVGRIAPLKQVHHLVKAVAAIEGCTLRLVGPWSDPGYVQEVQMLSHRLECADRVHLVGP